MASSIVLDDLSARLRAAGAAVESTRETWKAALEVRDELVVAAIDGGMSQRVVARAAGVSNTRVTSILLEA